MKTLVTAAAICLLTSTPAVSQEGAVMVSIDVEVIGFTELDFQRADSAYQLEWAALPRFPNFAAYYTFERTKCYPARGCFAWVTASPKQVTALANIPRPASQPYAPSRIINPRSPLIARWADEIEKARPSTVGGLVDLMLARVRAFVIYPEEGSSPRITTDEIESAARLNRVIGDCKTYSNLFVALARALGFPARMVMGYKIAPYGALGHAWAEIKIGSEWVPVEPQGATGNVSPNYVPTGVMSERASDDPSHREDRLVKVTNRS